MARLYSKRWTRTMTLAFAASTTTAFLPDANAVLYFQDLFFSLSRPFFPSPLHEKKIWIIGASSGIGEELATQLYTRHGARVILSSRNRQELLRVQYNCIGRKPMDGDVDSAMKDIHILPLDITKSKSMASIVQEALTFFNGIDILIINSGVGQLSSVTSQIHSSESIQDTMDATHDLMNVNLYGPVQLVMEVLRQSSWGKNSSSGHVVVTSSVAGIMSVPLCSSYAASKHALQGYFGSLRSECFPWLRVDLVCPGPVQTNFQRRVIERNTMHDSIHPRNEEPSVMSVERCAQLIISSIIGRPSILYHESWIATQPTLSFLYLNQFFPSLATFILGYLGRWRTKAWEMGLPLYKVSSWLQAAKSERQSLQNDRDECEGDTVTKDD